jgi:diguanylate cyclase (GGDEF)-like protein
MIELFKNEDTLKEEIEQLWKYRNFINNSEDEEEILENSFKILSKSYGVESFVVRDMQNNFLYIMKRKGVVLSEDLHMLVDYKSNQTFGKDYAVYWESVDKNNEEKEKIALLYFQLLVSSVRKLYTEKSIKYFSLRDSLTGLYNRKFLDEFCATIELQQERENIIYSVSMIDIDNFKAVNDTHGHTVGDEVIRVLADLIKKRIRKSDVVARYGGEEFIVLLYNTNPLNAKFAIESILEEFKKIVFKGDNESFKCSFSAGIDVLSKDNPSIKVVIHNADNALYFSKDNGRSMVSVFQDTQEK